MGERGVLKSALYSQLDQLDSSDAIVHLNQLEQRLAQQVSRAAAALVLPGITPLWEGFHLKGKN